MNFTRVCLSLFFIWGFSPQKSEQNYNSVIVVAEKVILSHHHELKKGSYAQMIINKCTEEGIFIRTKTDSGLVYYKDVTDVVFPIKDVKTKDINTKQICHIKRNTPLILIDNKKNHFIVALKDYRFEIDEKLLKFSNKEFFDSIIR